MFEKYLKEQPKEQVVRQSTTGRIHPVLFDSHHFVEVGDALVEGIFQRCFVPTACHLSFQFYCFSQVRHNCQGRWRQLLAGNEAHFLDDMKASP